jgi:hypothetical protein
MRPSRNSSLGGDSDRRSRRRRLAAIGVAAALVTLIAAWWLRPPPPWTVSLTPDELDVPPWTGIRIVATIAPGSLERSRFRYHWSADGEALDPKGSEIVWRTGTEGSHHVEVTVEGPRGVTHRARVDLSVYARDFVSVTGATMPAQPPPQADASLPFGIADVWVEKSEVCQGEPDRIRVRPFHQGGPAEERWLRATIGNDRSWETTYTPTLVRPGLQQIRITLVDEHDKEVETFAYVKVKDCIAPHPMFVRYESVAPDPEYVAFTALLFDGPAWQAWAHDSSPERGPIPRQTAARYRWEFGDGQTGTSTEPFVRHRYPPEGKRADDAATSYPVKVEAIDAEGRKIASTTTTVTLLNVVHELARKYSTLQLMSEVPPGPATRLEDGSRAVQVTLRNIHPTEAARMSSFVEKFVPCTGEAPTVQSLPPSAVFASDTVGASSSITGTFTVPPGQDGICSVAVEIKGTSTPGGLRVTGVFALDTGNRRGHALSPEQTQVLATVREQLGGGDVITATDIRRLEDQGVIPRGVLLK